MLIWPWKFTFFWIQPDAILNYVDNSMYLGKNLQPLSQMVEQKRVARLWGQRQYLRGGRGLIWKVSEGWTHFSELQGCKIVDGNSFFSGSTKGWDKYYMRYFTGEGRLPYQNFSCLILPKVYIVFMSQLMVCCRKDLLMLRMDFLFRLSV